MTLQNEPTTASGPPSCSRRRRLRIAAFSSAMLSSWNQMPVACRNATRSPASSALKGRPPSSIRLSLGTRPETTAMNSPHRSSISWSI
jgi:hypothetical protein